MLTPIYHKLQARRVWQGCKGLSIAAFIASVLAGCVVSPYNKQFVSAHTPVYFEGFALHAGSQINIRAYNKQTGNWSVVGTTTSGTEARTYNGDTLHPWHTQVTFDTLANWQCYFSSSCSLTEGTHQIRIQVDEVGVLNGLYTYDADGFACLEDQVNNGGAAMSAGISCRSADNPILHLYIITVD